MNKQAYEHSVSLILNKKAASLGDIKNGLTNIDWSGIGNAIKQHYLDNKKHYNRAAAGFILGGLGGGIADGWRGAGRGAVLGSLAFGGGSKLYDIYSQYQDKRKTEAQKALNNAIQNATQTPAATAAMGQLDINKTIAEAPKKYEAQKALNNAIQNATQTPAATAAMGQLDINKTIAEAPKKYEAQKALALRNQRAKDVQAIQMVKALKGDPKSPEFKAVAAALASGKINVQDLKRADEYLRQYNKQVAENERMVALARHKANLKAVNDAQKAVQQSEDLRLKILQQQKAVREREARRQAILEYLSKLPADRRIVDFSNYMPNAK